MYKQAIVGGTFDRFHRGHVKLLDEAFSHAEKVAIGISTENLYKHKVLSETIEPYEIREGYVREYLSQNNFEDKAVLVPIEDIFGTSLKEKNIDAIFVTEENVKAAKLINKRRAELHFDPLAVIQVPFVKGNDGLPISSERIRKGEIDRYGFTYKKLFENTSLKMPDSIRTKLQNPIGDVYKSIEDLLPVVSKTVMLIAVGDIVSYTLIEQNVKPDLCVIDFKTRRHALTISQRELFETMAKDALSFSNQAGKIEREASFALHNAIQLFLTAHDKQILKIKGEEDLLALPAILFAPLGSCVVYGQFGKGLVLINVTEAKKNEVLNLLRGFEQAL